MKRNITRIMVCVTISMVRPSENCLNTKFIAISFTENSICGCDGVHYYPVGVLFDDICTRKFKCERSFYRKSIRILIDNIPVTPILICNKRVTVWLFYVCSSFRLINSILEAKSTTQIMTTMRFLDKTLKSLII